MNLNHYPQDKLKKEISVIVGRHLDLKKHKIFIFGSRVVGKGDDGSDIDVGIEGPSEISSDVMAAIKEELDNLPLLYKIDLVDFKTVSADFRRVALNGIEVISDE